MNSLKLKIENSVSSTLYKLCGKHKVLPSKMVSNNLCILMFPYYAYTYGMGLICLLNKTL